MISIKVLGTGCKRCEKLDEIVRDVVETNQIEATVDKITELEEFIMYGILATPGLVINEAVVSSGIIPSKEKILEWINKGN